MTTRNSIQEAARRVRQTIEAWEEQYGGAEEAVPWEVVRTLIKPIDHICLYREEVDQPQQEENTPTAIIESEILAVRLDRIEKALARLSTQTPAPTQVSETGTGWAELVTGVGWLSRSCKSQSEGTSHQSIT